MFETGAVRSPWTPGISIVVLARSGPAPLNDTLRSLEAALLPIGEPWEVIVSVSDRSLAEYATLSQHYPRFAWTQTEHPSSFATLMQRTRYDGVYVLDGALQVADNAIELLLPWRAPNVFAIASQIVGPPNHCNTG
ncbi:MAG: hypothetical protein JO033_27175, partial [Acidobacteriaceae bacterium]|nr:hypothetical protein [Acidobacteriaceae bacterium]